MTWEKFRKWNERRSIACYRAMFGSLTRADRIAFRNEPFAWLWLVLVPIAGISFFSGTPQAYDHAIRERSLRRRKAALKARQA